MLRIIHDRESAKNHVSEGIPSTQAGWCHDPPHAQQGTKEFILPAALGAKPQDFLEGNDIRMKGRQDLGDPSGHDPAIHPATPVNVIGHYPNVENGLRSGNVWYRAGHG
jgi:hypothetical protein